MRPLLSRPIALPHAREGAMLTDLTIRQLQRYAGPASGVEEIARLGYLQWLGGLDAEQSYPAAAARACALARPFEGTAPAVRGVFATCCALRSPPRLRRSTCPCRHGAGGAARDSGAPGNDAAVSARAHRLPDRGETVETLYLLGEEDRIVGVTGYAGPARAGSGAKSRGVGAFTTADVPKIVGGGGAGAGPRADLLGGPFFFSGPRSPHR